MEKKIKIQIPDTPNFIRTDYKILPITDFTVDELKEIGKEWTENLIRKAREKGGEKVFKE